MTVQTMPNLSPAAAAPNAINCATCPPGVMWTTTNAGEALPGVVTPLTWSFFGDRTERAMRLMFYDLGVLKLTETNPSPLPQDRLWDLFYGRAAGNMNTFRTIADRTPGTSGSAVEEQIFGSSRPDVADRPTRGRYGVVAVKLPWSATRLPSRLESIAGDTGEWWQRTVAADLSTPAAAQAALREAAGRFGRVMRPHTLAAMLCQGLYEQVRALAERAGHPGLEIHLITGYGDMAETEVVSDLWSVSRDRLTIEEFVRRHGFHGPNEGELSARSWRISQDPLLHLIDNYRGMPDDRDPRLVEAGRGDERRAAEAKLLADVPASRRAAARLVLRIAARVVPLRGIGKAAFLRCSDVARLAARARGEQLVAEGVLTDAEDVFMLTVEELVEPTPAPDLGAVAAARRAIHDEYRTLDVPEAWDGAPVPVACADRGAAASDAAVSGLPVSPGIVEGIARLILDPESDDYLEPGEILVCRTTDPSWASTLMVAAALVIDIGGAISHGAIVARELGVPCVIGTRNGTAAIRTGDRLRVDGSTGSVEVLERAKT